MTLERRDIGYEHTPDGDEPPRQVWPLDFEELYPGRTLETFGPDEAQSRQIPERHIWTIVETDGDLYAVPGWHYVNRFLYYVSHHPWQSRDEEYLYHEGSDE